MQGPYGEEEFNSSYLSDAISLIRPIHIGGIVYPHLENRSMKNVENIKERILNNWIHNKVPIESALKSNVDYVIKK